MRHNQNCKIKKQVSCCTKQQKMTTAMMMIQEWWSWSKSIPSATSGAVVVLTTLFLYFLRHIRKQTSNTGAIPWAPGAIPLLGHALKYRKNPAQFLVQTSKTTGPIFQLNLAGKHMIVASGPTEQAYIATAPESIMSAKHAVAEIGFEQSLGHNNVHEGTEIHKGIVKGIWLTNPNQQVQQWIVAIESALEQEVAASDRKHQVEFFQLVRRVVLRATIDRMISPVFLSSWDFKFLDEFMSFQDTLEDVTAKSVVLPRWLALPALLWPLQRRRETLQAKIAVHLKDNILKSSNPQPLGFWLQELHGSHSPEAIAEYIVGLLFAAHKNPAIAAAQAYLMLLEQGTPDDQETCRKEAQQLLQKPEFSTLQSPDSRLRRLCLETLRLTAHSIGAVRTAQQDMNISTEDGKKYTIPKGASVALAHIASSLNDKLWTHPETLDTTRRDYALYQDEYKFTSFSHGVHKCPGQRLALVLVQCTVAILLQYYDIELPNKLPPLSFERATLAQREGPVHVTIRGEV
jgi:sterol 14-demethylase